MSVNMSVSVCVYDFNSSIKWQIQSKKPLNECERSITRINEEIYVLLVKIKHEWSKIITDTIHLNNLELI